jgi:hypothetical protein
VDVVVTDLTRMRDAHICIAGIDLATGQRVRPKLAGVSVPEVVARHYGGTVRLGSVLRFVNPWIVPAVPEIEDVIVPLDELVEQSRMAPGEFSSLVAAGSGRVVDQIEGLTRGASSMTVPEGSGRGSLAIAPCRPAFRLSVNRRGRVRAQLDAALNVSATDLRLYDGAVPNGAAVSELARRSRDTRRVVLGVGLTRPFSPDGESPPVHWLQLNTVHLLDDPYWEPSVTRPGSSAGQRGSG